VTKIENILAAAMGKADIVWETPKRPPRIKWDERLASLLSHPDRWARVHTIEKESIARSTVNSLKKGKLAVPAGMWVFTTEKLETGEWGIYACYLGPVTSDGDG